MSWKHQQSSFLHDIIREALLEVYIPGQVKDRVYRAEYVAGYECLQSTGGALIKQDEYSCINIF